MQHLARIPGLGARGVLVHQAREQLLVEAAPVHADAHRLIVLQRDLDDVGELFVALVAEADIAWVNAIFRERFRACGMLRQKLVPDIMEIADERHGHAELGELVADMGHRRRPPRRGRR